MDRLLVLQAERAKWQAKAQLYYRTGQNDKFHAAIHVYWVFADTIASL